MTATPRIAMGLFVYNGQRHLAAALDSLLAQTMGDFVLDISDNGSTDLTEEICRSYAARDSRVRYLRHEENRGALWNTNFVAQVSPETEYFKWCAHDDVYDSTYLEQCVARLDERPDIVGCHSRVRYINEYGDELMRSFQRLTFTDERPWERLNQILLRRHDQTYSFALLRRSVLSQTQPLQPVYKGDAILLAELALRGPFGEVSDHLFANRTDPNRASAGISTGRVPLVWAKWWGGSSRFPVWHTLATLRRTISSAPLGPEAKARCYVVVAGWMKTMWKDLGWDLAHDGPRHMGHLMATGWRWAGAQ